MKVNIWQTSLSTRGAIAGAALFVLALASLAYAMLTAPKVGIDVRYFQEGAREWADGVFEIGAGVVGVYTPFLLPMLYPIAHLPYDTLAIVWLVLNILSAAFCLYSAIALWGSEWAIDTRLALCAAFVAIAPFRVTLRNGQISLMVMALLLGALLARKRNKKLLAGALLGLSLCKYTLTLPFFLYLAGKREWKLISAAVLVPLALTEVFSIRLGLSLFHVIGQYFGLAGQILYSGLPGRTGTTEIKMLFLDLSGGNEWFASIVTLLLSTSALAAMAVVFYRKPRWESGHFAVLALFSLWSVYHRTYDSVLCLMPAALLVGFLVHKRFVGLSRAWLGALSLLIISVPGLLVDRLRLDPQSNSGNPLFFLGIHIERLVVFGMFWTLLILMWKSHQEPALLESAAIRTTDELARVNATS